MRQVLAQNASNHEESRYSSQEMERIIVKAAVMDAKPEESFTTEQIEEIAVQRGISLAAVRRVLAEETLHNTHEQTARRVLQTTPKSRSSSAAPFAALALAPLWAPLASLLALHLDSNSRYATLILFVIPLALCFLAGTFSRRKRIAVVSGALIGMATMIGCTIGWGDGPPGSALLGGALLAGAGAVVAALGAALRAMAFSSADSAAPASEEG